MDSISQEFLDYFCVRLDQIPVGGNIDECLDWGFKDNNDKIPDGVFLHFEGTINFNYNGITYMTRDGQDIREYLSSKGYKDGGSRLDNTVVDLAAWYDIQSVMIYKYPIEHPTFRKYAAIAFSHQVSPTLEKGDIGVTDEEIHETIERVRAEEDVFSDDTSKWLNSEWGSNWQIIRDQGIYNVAVRYLHDCLDSLNYGNVNLDTEEIDIESRKMIIDYWLQSNGINEGYQFSQPYVKTIEKGNCHNKQPFLIDLEKEQDSLIVRPKPMANSLKEVINALEELKNKKNGQVSGRTR